MPLRRDAMLAALVMGLEDAMLDIFGLVTMARSSAGAIDLEQGDAVTAEQNRSRVHCISFTMDITALQGHWRPLRWLALALALALPWAARTAPMADARGAAASFAPALNRALPITLGVY